MLRAVLGALNSEHGVDVGVCRAKEGVASLGLVVDQIHDGDLGASTLQRIEQGVGRRLERLGAVSTCGRQN
eukprot:9173872-Pyramimonas_sp.AAC.1